MKIKVFRKPEKVQGFNFQEGFAALLDGEKIVAATSGHTCNSYIYIYRPQNGGWAGEWEDGEDAASLSQAILDWEDKKGIEKALECAAGKKLHISEKDIVFTNVFPGEKCNNGGEYGFYTRYCPIPGYPGIYRVFTETTCDFDACGTGYEGIKALTTAEYRELLKESDEIEAAGSLY